MLSDALVLAILSTIGLIMLYAKLPRKVRRFLEKHAVLTDFVTFILTYLSLGSTLTALTAGAMVAIFTSCIIHISANKEDFLYVYDFMDMVKEGMAELKKTLEDAGQGYRERKKERLHAVQAAG